MMDIREIVLKTFSEALIARDKTLKGDLSDEMILLESGLDSLGFAILVARLEEELDYDPFTLMDTPVYPETLGEFIAIYEKYANHVKGD